MVLQHVAPTSCLYPQYTLNYNDKKQKVVSGFVYIRECEILPRNIPNRHQ